MQYTCIDTNNDSICSVQDYWCEAELEYLQFCLCTDEDCDVIGYSDGREAWWLHGNLHRLEGPALINVKQGYWYWYFQGELHREDGPAIYPQNVGSCIDYKCWYYLGHCVHTLLTGYNPTLM